MEVQSSEVHNVIISCEAEFFALSEAVKEIMFVVMILESMGISVELPIVV
jgi:hypothetical protein